MSLLSKPFLAIVAAVLAAFSAVSTAQEVPFSRNSLTNRDVIVLAKAGFNEDFIIETILGSRTQFNITVDALADLAKQGMTERLIRVMMSCRETRPPIGSELAPVVTTAVVPPLPQRSSRRSPTVRPSLASVAIASQTPYYESTSVFWGLWKKKISVGAIVQQPVVPVHLGVMYRDVSVQRIPAFPRYAGQDPAPLLPPYQATPLYNIQAAPFEP